MINPKEQQILAAHLLGLSREDYLRLQPPNPAQLQQLCDRREAGEPIAKIIGRKAFWRDDFFTNQHTLDPRPESELIIETMLELYPNRNLPLKILDLGTGTGCLLLSLLREYPNAKGVGIDISNEAITIANRNANALKLQNHSVFHNLSWTELDKSLYNVIITNPPYIPTNDIDFLECDVRDYDPIKALDGGDDGLNAYRQIFTLINNLLNHDSVIICEIGINQQDDVNQIANDAGFINSHSKQDLAGIVRTLAFKKTDF